MSRIRKMELRDIMTTAWLFVKKAGYSLSAGLKRAWKLYKSRSEAWKKRLAAANAMQRKRAYMKQILVFNF